MATTDSPWSPAARLAVISFLTLFAELAFIRWLSAETRFFGFYKNMVLISCVMGLGAGATLGKGGTWGRWFMPAVAAFSLVVLLVSPQLVRLTPLSGDEFIWVPQDNQTSPVWFYLAFLAFFVLNTAVFFAGGQAVGAAFEKVPSLRGYSINLLGSLAGTVAFAVMSYLQLGPVWWFSVTLVLGAAMTWSDRPVRLATGGLGIVSLVLLGFLSQGSSWSPYYKITVDPYRTPDGAPWGAWINTNTSYHLSALDLSEQFLAAHPDASKSYPPAYYNLPYRFLRPKRVLVLGAGAGNDVAAAIRNGAESVTAVEIDPVIAEFGRRLHPEKPYDSERVRVVVDDARAYLQKSTNSYDLIVYGLLDSHTVLAAMSNVRLDNFMYTRESFERARSLLAPNGMIALSFSSGWGQSYWILRRIAFMLEQVFGKRPVILDVGYDRGVVFLAGPGAPTNVEEFVDPKRLELARAKLDAGSTPTAELELTDDWPFMYLKSRTVPIEYWIMAAVVLVMAAVMIFRLNPAGQRSFDAHFFFLGAGFLLVEVRNLAELSLLFGSTWVVNTFVISGVLLMALLANLVAARWRINLYLAFALLGVAVAASLFSPVKYLSGAAPWVKIIVGTGILSLPFLFSGLVFSTSFRDTPSTSVAYGSNLLGAVAGGLLEHASLALGIRSLSAIALVLYVLAFVTLSRKGTKAVGGAPAIS
ncbi:MAG: methyltransferase domain-containing protein [Myxococcaceae bacterium]|nr:methyltransferase domain-containing protein [Myxococcaceae bacterium]